MIIQPVFTLPIVLSLILLLIGGSIFILLKNRENKALMYTWIRRIVIILLMGILIIRPGIGAVEETQVYTSQYDIYFVVDTTNSMNAEDWNPEGGTRLEQAKEDIQKLILNYSGARYSLITFDSVPVIRTPLTHNSDAITSSVKVLNVEVSKYSKGSSISIADALLYQVLKQNIGTNPDRARIVFYFGDGEQTTDTPPESFKNSKPLINAGEVYGYGTKDGGVMKRNNGYIITTNHDEYVMDNTQNPPVKAKSIIDEDNLNKIAEQLGVGYQHRTPDNKLEMPRLDTSKFSATDVAELKISADFTWLVAVFLSLMLSVEIISTYLRYRRNFSTRGLKGDPNG